MAAPTDIRLSSTRIGENKSNILVGSLAWTDKDRGDTPTYTVSDDRFEVLGNKLWLKAGNAFDYETTTSVDLTITVKDSTGNTYSEDFTLGIVNANEAPTDIALSGNRVAENKAGAAIGRLTATDQDANERFTYSVTDERFELVNNLLKLKDGVSLDFERTPTVNLAVTVTDRGGASYREVLTIEVQDVAEAPTDLRLSNNRINENNPGGLVGTLAAVDPDRGDTARYTVSDDRFEVVGNKLKLKEGIALDHEAEDRLVVTVTVTDSAGLTYSERMAILVQDVNERPTGITLSNDSFALNQAGDEIGRLRTIDPDSGNSFTYRLGGSAGSKFEIVNGVLKLKDDVSLTSSDDVTLTIISTDQGNLSVSQSFTLHAEQPNHAPTGITLSNATVKENLDGANIGRLTAIDPDAGDTFTYSIDDDRFVLANNLLRLAPGTSLDHEATPTITLAVTATDNGGLHYTQNLSITVADVNEAPVVARDIPDAFLAAGRTYAVDLDNFATPTSGTPYFTDPDGDTLAYTGTLMSASDGAFEWIKYDAVTHVLTATPGTEHVGDFVTVRIVADDQHGKFTYQDITITIVPGTSAAADSAFG
ncbi:hypothetical protein IAI18_15005 [Acetobacteraceae bacterium H6797]|nr:hypothetical protein [Acetobacteraceae bacterium H6797]